MHKQVKEFIEHYVYLIEKGQIDMLLFIAGKEFETQRKDKMNQLIDILIEIDIDTKDAQERLFIGAFKEIFEKLQKLNLPHNHEPLYRFLLNNMTTSYGLPITDCGELLEKAYPDNIERTKSGDWMLKW